MSDSMQDTIFTPIEFNKCKLIKLINKQIKGDHYNDPLLWIYERIDDIIQYIHIDINEQLYRNKLADYLEDMYKPFEDYLINYHKDAFIRKRNNRFGSDIEYHALHEFLKQHGFNKENVIKFIEIDSNDRTIYKSFRDYASVRYFSKYSLYQLNKSDYNSEINKKYNYIYEDDENSIEYYCSQMSI